VDEPLRIGVLAVQGNFREHAAMLRVLGAEAVEVRLPEELDGLDGLVIPGGESTAIGRLMRLYGLEEALRRFARPVFGTCAGMILLDRNHLDLVDVDLELEGETEPLRGVFIRAPRVRDVGPEVEVLAELDGEPVLLRDGRFLVASFHPELTDDLRVHEQFLALVREETNVGA
jgi:5'-phosphate synthase pdxT subunit